MSAYAIANGSIIDVLRDFNDNSFDALMCDPPYGFSFMGKAWDYDVPSVETWAECLRVLKPGAPLVAFGGSRTYHRLACKVEDAGFEMRDCLMWLYGKGFPKSQNIGLAIDKSAGAAREVVGINPHARPGDGKCENLATSGVSSHAANLTAPATELAQTWDGYGTALKPAHEPIVLARKPLEGTMANNVARFGVGGLAINGCRIGEEGGTAKGNPPKGPSNGIFGNGLNGACDIVELDAGRWPANLILDEEAGELLDASVLPTTSRAYPQNDPVERSGVGVGKFAMRTAGGYSDSGGPSRFFYCSKVSTKEREAGCEGLALRSAGKATNREDESVGLENPRAGANRTGGARNHHPTLKPLSLTTWLGKLIRPPTGGVILVPFSGAGSEMIGALRAGWSSVFGIEREAEYVQIAHARLRHWCPESEAA